MLDQQRQRSSAQQQTNANYTRAILFTHLVVGVLGAGLLLFHELLVAALVVILWYLHSLGLIYGMSRMQQWCRITLALWFALGGLAALLYALGFSSSPAESSAEPAMAVRLIPFWLSSLGMGYLAAGATVALSHKVERATTYGFGLWVESNPW